MTRSTSIDPLRRLLARIASRRRDVRLPSTDWRTDREAQSPEQRLLGVVARYGRGGSLGDIRARQLSNAAAAGVRTVAPAELSDQFEPTWVRRLSEPGTVTEPGSATDPAEPAVAALSPDRPPIEPHRPRQS
jgi:hypothetical protein